LTRKKTNASKRLANNPGCRFVPGSDLSAGGSLGSPPDHLDADGRRLWTNLRPYLERTLGAGEGDRVLLACLCAAWSHHVNAERGVRQHGRVVEIRDANGVVKSAGPSPDFRVSMAALDVVKRLASEFALSPVARASSAIQPPVEPQDDVDLILYGPT